MRIEQIIALSDGMERRKSDALERLVKLVRLCKTFVTVDDVESLKEAVGAMCEVIDEDEPMLMKAEKAKALREHRVPPLPDSKLD